MFNSYLWGMIEQFQNYPKSCWKQDGVLLVYLCTTSWLMESTLTDLTMIFLQILLNKAMAKADLCSVADILDSSPMVACRAPIWTPHCPNVPLSATPFITEPQFMNNSHSTVGSYSLFPEHSLDYQQYFVTTSLVYEACLNVPLQISVASLLGSWRLWYALASLCFYHSHTMSQMYVYDLFSVCMLTQSSTPNPRTDLEVSRQQAERKGENSSSNSALVSIAEECCKPRWCLTGQISSAVPIFSRN